MHAFIIKYVQFKCSILLRSFFLFYFSFFQFVSHFNVLFLLFFSSFILFFPFFSFSLLLTQAFPFAFILMSNKSRLAYEHVFNYIDKNIFPLSSVASFTTDYELAMRGSIAACNPSAKLYACHFHFAQACKRRAAQTNGFVELVRSNKEAESIYYRLLSLPLLPVDHIIPAFNELNAEARKLKSAPMRQFLAYYRRQWILSVSSRFFFGNFPFVAKTLSFPLAFRMLNGIIIFNIVVTASDAQMCDLCRSKEGIVVDMWPYRVPAVLQHIEN